MLDEHKRQTLKVKCPFEDAIVNNFSLSFACFTHIPRDRHTFAWFERSFVGTFSRRER